MGGLLHAGLVALQLLAMCIGCAFAEPALFPEPMERLQEGRDETYADLVLFDVANGPRLLDAANVAFGNHTFFFRPVRLSVDVGNDLLMTQSTHFNSSQGYAHTTLILVRDDRLELVDTIFTFSERTCANERTQQLSVGQGSGEPFAEVTATVTEITTHSSERCGEATAPEPGTRTLTGTYRWDAAAKRYIPDSDVFEVLAGENEERF